ncbi:MAG: FmdB family zinc ribbon protein [Terriglobales bacterium]
MPLYEYECKKCHHRFERIQKFSDPHLKKCPDCGGTVELVVSAPAIKFKGSGWYVNDYAKKSGADSSSKADSGSKTEAGAKSDSESKGESESKSKKEEKSKRDSSDSSKKTEKKASSREKS